MTFGESVSTCLKKYFVFKGRASRSEYWWFQLIVSPSYFISTVFENDISYIFLGITLFTLIPPIKGIKLINTKNPDLFVSCNLLTPAEIAGIRVNNVMPRKM